MERHSILRGLAADDWPERPLWHDFDHLAVAAQAMEKAGRPRLIVPPLHYCAALKVPVSGKVPPETREVSDGVRVWTDFTRPPKTRNEALYHGLSHVICMRTRKSHNEADVWCVAAELVLPMAVAVRCASVADACRLQPHAPPSLLEAILERTWARELFLRASIG